MATNYLLSGKVNQATVNVEIHVWEKYPQVKTLKTESVNRLGSSETVVQRLYVSSTAMQCTAVALANTYQVGSDLARTFNLILGVPCTLTDNINNIAIQNVVITNLTHQIKKVGGTSGGWIVVYSFDQHIQK